MRYSCYRNNGMITNIKSLILNPSPSLIRRSACWFIESTRKSARTAVLVSSSSLSTSSVTNGITTPTTTTTDSSAGLFSISELQTPKDFSILTQHAIQQCNHIRSSLASIVASSSTGSAASEGVDSYCCVSTIEEASDMLCQLDDISKIVCNVIDAAELCRSVHAVQEWRHVAQESFVQLSDYLSILNADTTLYDASQLVSNTKEHNTTVWNSLSEEERRFVQLLQAEFVRDGIHLSYYQRMQVRELQNHIVQIESIFLQNITNSRQLFTIHNNDDENNISNSVKAVTDVIPLDIIQRYGGIVSHASSDGTITPTPTPSTTIQIGNTDTQILQTLLRYSSDPILRKQIYYESMTSVSENLDILQELRSVRHNLAVQQNFTSYIERNLLDKMIGTSTNDVQQFLNVAVQQNQASFIKDMTVLSQTKQQLEGNATLEPWDITYYSSIIKAHHYQDLHHNVSQYLTIPNCINAMQILVQELFGITMQETSLSPIEQWDIAVTGDHSSHSQQPQTTKLRKFQFTGPDFQPLGTMYIDLHSREHKYNHAAHFTVRCGCAIRHNYHPNMDVSSNNKNENDGTDKYQYPIIALVCNLSDTATVTHGEVETLYHEFGHALHSLLSRTKFQHLSGTRTALDFVETPSHLFENFVWDTQFLQLLGRHHATGEVIPMDMIQQIQQSRYQLASIERQNQILYSLFDQRLFGVPDTSDVSSTQLFGALHKPLNIPYAEGTHWYTRFGHLVSYGGGYYGYLYSQVFARDIWTQCFEHRSLDRTAGNQLWHKLLRFGGSKDPHVMLTDLLGRPSKVNFI